MTPGSEQLHAIGSRKDLRRQAYYAEIADLLTLREVQALKDFRHHIVTTRYQHCLNVSYYNYRLCRMLRLDAASAARAGLLHDLYHYNTKHYTRGEHGIRHSSFHPILALEQAEALVEINDRERDMIYNHMWPVTRSRPRYAETYVLTLVDKYCAVAEFLGGVEVAPFSRKKRPKTAFSAEQAESWEKAAPVSSRRLAGGWISF